MRNYKFYSHFNNRMSKTTSSYRNKELELEGVISKLKNEIGKL